MGKQEKAGMLDPNRFKIAKNMTVVPGGPENNNPMNVTDNASPEIKAPSIYGDYSQNYPQMGTAMVNPAMVKPSMQRPLNDAPQPSANAQEPMEGIRLGMDATNRGLNSSQFMGMIGSPTMMPGAMDPGIPGGSGSLGMFPTTQNVDGGEMVPGSTPKKIQKKGKK